MSGINNNSLSLAGSSVVQSSQQSSSSVKQSSSSSSSSSATVKSLAASEVIQSSSKSVHSASSASVQQSSSLVSQASSAAALASEAMLKAFSNLEIEALKVQQEMSQISSSMQQNIEQVSTNFIDQDMAMLADGGHAQVFYQSSETMDSSASQVVNDNGKVSAAHQSAGFQINNNNGDVTKSQYSAQSNELPNLMIQGKCRSPPAGFDAAVLAAEQVARASEKAVVQEVMQTAQSSMVSKQAVSESCTQKSVSEHTVSSAPSLTTKSISPPKVVQDKPVVTSAVLLKVEDGEIKGLLAKGSSSTTSSKAAEETRRSSVSSIGSSASKASSVSATESVKAAKLAALSKAETETTSVGIQQYSAQSASQSVAQQQHSARISPPKKATSELHNAFVNPLSSQPSLPATQLIQNEGNYFYETASSHSSASQIVNNNGKISAASSSAGKDFVNDNGQVSKSEYENTSGNPELLAQQLYASPLALDARISPPRKVAPEIQNVTVKPLGSVPNLPAAQVIQGAQVANVNASASFSESQKISQMSQSSQFSSESVKQQTATRVSPLKCESSEELQKLAQISSLEAQLAELARLEQAKLAQIAELSKRLELTQSEKLQSARVAALSQSDSHRRSSVESQSSQSSQYSAQSASQSLAQQQQAFRVSPPKRNTPEPQRIPVVDANAQRLAQMSGLSNTGASPLIQNDGAYFHATSTSHSSASQMVNNNGQISAASVSAGREIVNDNGQVSKSEYDNSTGNPELVAQQLNASMFGNDFMTAAQLMHQRMLGSGMGMLGGFSELPGLFETSPLAQIERMRQQSRAFFEGQSSFDEFERQFRLKDKEN